MVFKIGRKNRPEWHTCDRLAVHGWIEAAQEAAVMKTKGYFAIHTTEKYNIPTTDWKLGLSVTKLSCRPHAEMDMWEYTLLSANT